MRFRYFYVRRVDVVAVQVFFVRCEKKTVNFLGCLVFSKQEFELFKSSAQSPLHEFVPGLPGKITQGESLEHYVHD